MVYLDIDKLLLATVASVRYKLAMADALNRQTAQLHQASLLTQDADFKDAPGVLYRPKTV